MAETNIVFEDRFLVAVRGVVSMAMPKDCYCILISRMWTMMGRSLTVVSHWLSSLSCVQRVVKCSDPFAILRFEGRSTCRRSPTLQDDLRVA
jgi:hypothetical protein